MRHRTPKATVPPDPRLERWEAGAELPLLAASLVFLAGYALHVLVPEGNRFVRETGLVAVGVTWLMFLVDYAVRYRLSRQRPIRFVRTHWLDTVVLVLPLLRPLRVVKVYTAIRRRGSRARLGLHARVITYAGLSALLLGFAGALNVYQAERHAPDATIRTFGDSVWWVAATLTTVGYGDVVPVTVRGRTVAVGMMIGGLALLGAVTGSFSSWLLSVFAQEGDDEAPGE
ncbi:two pore domain potassium channel family protein [Streptomyces globosus]|uniref:Two pore domain potassium channel family protein n=1 Tax=Streptomyces globosus TaxID=68209 RepID=A0A344U3Y3_9ACTN|nr:MULTISPECIES: potassium channel family protein [Streptomyces]AXE25604.1 two pore domain potassium channel family protein [Streptomyces globosus]